MNRLLASLGGYVYGLEGDTLFVNHYVSSTLSNGGISASLSTSYPNDGLVRFSAKGVKRIAFRIPSWCESYTLNKPHTLENGYAIVENDEAETVLELAVTAKAVFSDAKVIRDVGRVCFMRGPVVYCAEAVDNPYGLHSYLVSPDARVTESYDKDFGLFTLELDAKRLAEFDGALYSSTAPRIESAKLRLIPFNCFANRGESDMLVWFNTLYK